ncbi:hypothetical protein KC095_12570 [Acinetobacter nosocomialis]|jgi:hypothetical protein|nr:hypothetical protein DKE48_017450 [Acinetobacter nosocomialis]EXR26470.1 hypothetical protein J694_3241 [Acinetobacter sp. 1281984]MCO9051005.1 hypothetical protein [Acinetobacter sp. UC24323]PNN09248.1 hypothetical protein AL489_004250 [Acinetobacter sp. FDAARGOS_131]SSR40306.1 Uncharacterised protein [Acinetobacter baumannii]
MVEMTKRQILQRLFLRFLMKNSFHKLAFTEIWSLFVGHNSYLNNDENFEVVHSFFIHHLVKEYFIVDSINIPQKYTSKYHAYQIKKFCLPVELQEPYESICEKTNQLNKALQQNELEIECLNECFNEFPSIRFQIELLIQKKKDYQFSLQSKVNVLKELIQTF